MNDSSETRFVGYVIKLAFALGAAGLLPWATLLMAKLALEDCSRGLVSIGAWNRRLVHSAPAHQRHMKASHIITTRHK